MFNGYLFFLTTMKFIFYVLGLSIDPFQYKIKEIQHASFMCIYILQQPGEVSILTYITT